MGCDIHCYVETKSTLDLGDWSMRTGFISDEYTEGHHYYGSDKYKNRPHLLENRDYGLFGILAGVRRGTAYIEPRGLPCRVSWQIKEEHNQWEGDAHSTSYLYLRELIEMADEGIFDPESFMVTSGIPQLVKLSEEDNVKDVRIVFWFDN